MKLVVSAVNLVDGGALQILKEVLDAAEKLVEKDSGVTFTFLIASKSIHDGYTNKHNYIYFPNSKKRWLNRLHFEYITSHKLSKSLNPDLWISLHDISPRVKCKQVVYCHNPSPFLEMPLVDIKIDFKQYLFSKLYKYLYRININSNKYVIVQQHWLKKRFQEFFPKVNIIVSRPTNIKDISPRVKQEKSLINNKEKIIFYPAYPRYFKNQELIVDVAKICQDNEINVKFILTIDGTENNYARRVVEKAEGLKNIQFIGLIPKSEVEVYYHNCDALIFPSLLETWGLPITEFAIYGKPILLPKLDYARETSQGISNLFYFDPRNTDELFYQIKKAISGKNGEIGQVIKNTETDYKTDGILQLLKFLIEQD